MFSLMIAVIDFSHHFFLSLGESWKCNHGFFFTFVIGANGNGEIVFVQFLKFNQLCIFLFQEPRYVFFLIYLLFLSIASIHF